MRLILSLSSLLLLANGVLSRNISPRDDMLSNSTVITQGGCQQGECPDHNQGFDYLLAHDMPLTSTRGWIRVNNCGKCFHTNNVGAKGACYDFTTDCDGKQTICIDPAHQPAHRQFHTKGGKLCYNMVTETHPGCQCGGGYKCDVNVWYPRDHTACTW